MKMSKKEKLSEWIKKARSCYEKMSFYEYYILKIDSFSKALDFFTFKADALGREIEDKDKQIAFFRKMAELASSIPDECINEYATNLELKQKIIKYYSTWADMVEKYK